MIHGHSVFQFVVIKKMFDRFKIIFEIGSSEGKKHRTKGKDEEIDILSDSNVEMPQNK